MKTTAPTKKRLSSGLTGVAGEYSVAAELSRQGYLASITLRNTKGVDILAGNQSASKSAAIQVKTNQGYKKHWILHEKAEDFHAPHFFYIFVNLGTQTGYPEFHIVPSHVVAKFVKKNHHTWLTSPGKNGQVRRDSTVRKFSDDNDEYLNRWDLLELD